MRVLIVEDNAFNAFCLTRLFEAVCRVVQVTVVTESLNALHKLEQFQPDLVVIDGDLGAGDSRYCNGPLLADLIWRKYPNKAIVAWTDNQLMRRAFEEVFHVHHKPFRDCTMWSKIMPQHQLYQALVDLSKVFNLGYYWQANSSFHLDRLYA
ncbi:response regulator transcription factor [Legionella impletisoli]|uniref:Response regulator n=1 Tax=Legionella impletisoli TaxID=343510 RepID=A0A917JXU0_9GAMM|nr:response regulator transcription factor [Legionella impletisoli]GGI87451.1 response regulator [Legionella impletisoli]